MDKEIFERRKRELVESIRVAYDLLDTGKTGHVTPQRLAEVDDNHEDNKYNPNEIEDFTREFLKLDENGGLDFEEFYNIILEGFQNPAMLDQGLEIAFKAFDRRKKELIDSEDFKAAMEEFGKVIAIEPYLQTVVIGGGALKAAGGPLADALIPDIIAGNAIIAFAYVEPQGRYDLANLRTSARKDGAGYVLKPAR